MNRQVKIVLGIENVFDLEKKMYCKINFIRLVSENFDKIIYVIFTQTTNLMALSMFGIDVEIIKLMHLVQERKF